MRALSTSPGAGRVPAATAPVAQAGRGLLEAVGPHGAQARIGDELATFFMLVIAIHEGVFFGLPVEALELVGVARPCPARASTRSMLLAMRAAIRQSGIAWPGGSMYFSVSRMRRSPFIEVRLASPEVAAGSHTWQASPILVGTISTSTANRPPFLIASTIALTIAARSP